MPRINPRLNHPTFKDLPPEYQKVLTDETCLFHGIAPAKLDRVEIQCIEYEERQVIWRQGQIFYDADSDFLRVIAEGSVSISYEWEIGGNKEPVEVAKYGPCFVVGELESYIKYDVLRRQTNTGAMVEARNESGRVDYRAIPYTLTATSSPTSILFISGFFKKFGNNPQVLLNLIGIISTKHLLLPDHLKNNIFDLIIKSRAENKPSSHPTNLSTHHLGLIKQASDALNHRFKTVYIPTISKYCLSNSGVFSQTNISDTLDGYINTWFEIGQIPLRKFSTGKSVNIYDQASRDMKKAGKYHIFYGSNPYTQDRTGTKSFHVTGKFLLINPELRFLVPPQILAVWLEQQSTSMNVD